MKGLSDSSLKLSVLGILILQNCSLILLMRYSRVTGDAENRYITSTAVFISEVLKGITSIIVLYCGRISNIYDCIHVPSIKYVEEKINVIVHTLRTDYISNWKEILKLTVPAGLYVIQNNLQYVATSNLPASVFQVLTQLKIVTTAFFSVFMLSKQLSWQQWFAIVFLSAGVGTVQVSQQMNKSTSSSSTSDNFMLGLMCVLLSCITSGFAGVYFEKVLKSGHISLWLRNIHLSMIGALLSLVCSYSIAL